eukprot:3129992-Rhodomonas_salina.1
MESLNGCPPDQQCRPRGRYPHRPPLFHLPHLPSLPVCPEGQIAEESGETQSEGARNTGPVRGLVRRDEILTRSGAGWALTTARRAYANKTAGARRPEK